MFLSIGKVLTYCDFVFFELDRSGKEVLLISILCIFQLEFEFTVVPLFLYSRFLMSLVLRFGEVISLGRFPLHMII